MKKWFGVLAGISLLGIFCTVGALEQESISLRAGVLHLLVELLIFAVACELFENVETKSRPRCSRPKGGKRKSLI